MKNKTEEEHYDLPHHARNDHGIPHGKNLVKHRVVVAGFYFARQKAQGDHTGEKRRVAYREEFILAPSEHRLHGQGALGHVLSDKLLAERLTKKDPDFRGVQTHEIVEHENVLVDAPKKEKKDAE